jgi:hypothetical protein
MLAGLVAVIVVLGGWGLTGSRDGQPAALGEAVAFPGGTFSVLGVADVDLSHPMAGPGMQMPMGAGVPQVAEGSRRVEVDVTMTAGRSNVRFETDRFRVHGVGFEAMAPVAPDQGGTFLPAGGQITRTLTFEIPADATGLSITLEDGDRAVAAEVGPAPEGDGHDH